MQGFSPSDAFRQPLADRRDGALFFEAKYRLRTGDVDQDMRLRLDGMARTLQDVANDNLEATDFAHTDPFWIVRRTVIDVIEPISWPGTVTAQRWCGALSTRWTNMRVRMTAEHETNLFNPTQRPAGLVETEAFWINVNQQGLPARISDGGFALLSSMNDVHRLKWKSMNPDLPSEADADTAAPVDRQHVLRSTDFDPFKHMNNAAYWAAVEDELVDHPDLTATRHRAVLEYLRPISPDTIALTVRRRREGDQLQMWLLANGVTAATATVTRLT
ncbi:acyl-ACP thioesterase [Antrihabitans sp. YC3-6]|uniref:Acyl-ACP thioesterase n=1 Tax=Antrihabitans stalagmiti TaxID=2799499 RepID=A0A934NLH6_9NOCA|nr:acyl-ACP thioesterase domain-containing protein [Antrihabitans stalagmiti]MBJ8337399.1 acyl-ACP thioesterase [Antrihabitans stalagmiti]